MNEKSLFQAIPSNLEESLQTYISPGEQVLVKLKGTFNEALVCTDRRVLILKSGLMTQNLFGAGAFQLMYSAITSADVHSGIFGYLELSAGGVQNRRLRTWPQGFDNPSHFPNCISLRPDNTDLFRKASSLIVELAEDARRPRTQAVVEDSDVAVSLERLWKLKTERVITQDEFDKAKAKIFSR